jgi:O-antigen/teichoic acid export membrane protein
MTKPEYLLSEGGKRTTRAYKNIFYSFLIKGISIVSQFVMVPLTLNYLDKMQYGIWLTIASLVSWFSFFDIGIGNGLRNKLAESLAKKEFFLAKTHVSTAYFLVFGIFFVLIVLFWFINPYLNWASILNTPPALGRELAKIVLFVFTIFCLRFVLVLIGNILYAYQQPALNNLMNPLGNILSLIVIYILTITTKSSLFLVAVTFSTIPLIVLLAFNIFFFAGRFRDISPGIRFINLKHSKDLLGLGLQFFIIQVASLVLFTSSNIILAQLFGPSEVTVYNIAFKYFTVISMIYGIIMTPFWSAFTEAYVKQDLDWIRITIKKMEYVAYGLIAVSLIMFVVAKPVYSFWIGNSVTIPTSMNLVLCLFVITSLLGSPYNTFINGTGKIRLQLYTAVISILITIPLAIVLGKNFHLGSTGVVLATLVTTLPTMILWRIQYKKILSGVATGIWNK